MREQADAVIMWVDGADPKHLEKRLFWQSHGRIHPAAKEAVRFSDFDELKYCILSIKKYCNFVRNIYIVTDDQFPEFLNTPPFLDWLINSRIVVIDHKIIFRENDFYLPVFNSNTIEAFVYKIPGLLDKFIIFNDDFFVLKKVDYDYFFENGLPIYRGGWARLSVLYKFKNFISHYFASMSFGRPMFSRAQKEAAILNGFYDFYFKIDHIPRPFLKSHFESMFLEYRSWVDVSGKYRFRDVRQPSPLSLCIHYGLNRKICAISKDLNLFYLSRWTQGLDEFDKRLDSVSSDGNYLFACIQNFGVLEDAVRMRLNEWLEDVVKI